MQSAFPSRCPLLVGRRRRSIVVIHGNHDDAADIRQNVLRMPVRLRPARNVAHLARETGVDPVLQCIDPGRRNRRGDPTQVESQFLRVVAQLLFETLGIGGSSDREGFIGRRRLSHRTFEFRGLQCDDEIANSQPVICRTDFQSVV